jgi:hypothetical protein
MEEIVIQSSRESMTREQRDGFYLLGLGCLVFVLFGSALEHISPVSMTDFRTYYYSARCLLQNHDPYDPKETSAVYHAEETERPNDSTENQMVITKYIYLPGTLSLTVPGAMLPFGLCRVLWMIANAGCLILAAFLTWDLAIPYAPIVSGALLGFLVANSELILITGNAVGLAVGLCVVAVWCFMKKRLELIGVVCLAVSLVLKPHDAGLVWLYFVLAGGISRRRALQSLLAVAIISAPGIAWVTAIAPNWIGELSANISALSVHGGITDPGPSSSGAHALAMQINLQTVLSMIKDDPRFYNPASYLPCGALVALWAGKVMRSHSEPRTAWIALAVVASLTMLPVYHRQDDAKLLLLAIPACAALWAERTLIGRLALAVTTVGLIATAEIPWAIGLTLLRHLQLPDVRWLVEALKAVQILPAPLALLAVSCFYLWLLVKTPPQSESAAADGSSISLENP